MRKQVGSLQFAVGSRWSAEKAGQRRVCLSLLTANCELPIRSRGFTLLELIITLTILTILTLGVSPLVKLSVQRQKEQRLREALREIRMAIQEFHRDTYGACPGGAQGGINSSGIGTGGGGIPGQQQQQQQGGAASLADPRSRVIITDCKIFTVDNPDRYPPDLETLVNGVNIVPRGGQGNIGGGAGLSGTSKTATEANSELSTKKKVYLRQIPVDPMTGEAEWEFRSSYDAPDASSWGKENIFDVRSKAQGTALNGEKYSDW
jgi:general secretion pathway protein G